MLNSTHAIHSTQPTTIRAPPPPPPPLQLSYAGLLRGLDDGQSHGPETPHTDGAAWLNLRHKSDKSNKKSDEKSDKSDKKKGDCVRLCACACVSRHHAYFPLPLAPCFRASSCPSPLHYLQHRHTASGRTLQVLKTAPSPVVTPQPKRHMTSSGALSGIFAHEMSATTVYSLWQQQAA